MAQGKSTERSDYMVTMDFVFRFQRKIIPSQAAVIEYLINNGGQFYGSYRDFAEAMGKSKSYATNLCKIVHELEEMGIITTVVDEKITKYTKTLVGLNADWMERI